MAEREDKIYLLFENALPVSVLEKITQSARFLTTQEIERDPIVFMGKGYEVFAREIFVSRKDGGTYFIGDETDMMYKVDDVAECIDGTQFAKRVGSKEYTQAEVDGLMKKQPPKGDYGYRSPPVNTN